MNGRPTTRVRRPVVVAAAFAVAAVVVRLAFLGAPVGSDEAGFLLVADQWHPGASLYGDYWVDRPPLLLAIFALSSGLTAVRLAGCLAVVVVVAAVAVAAGRLAGSRAAVVAAGSAAAWCSMPWLGIVRVNGEVLAAPFVAVSIAATVLALHAPTRRHRVVLAIGAGVCAAAAVGVKQSSVDALVFALVALVSLWLARPERRRDAIDVLVGGIVGGIVVTAALLALAAARGTGARDLFEAVVTFRIDAGETIRTASTAATDERFGALAATWVVSGLAVVAVAAVVLAVRRRDPFVVATAATVLAGSVVAVLGGSYWAHYLLALVPASAVAAGLLAATVRPRVLAGGAAWLAVATAVSVGHTVVAGVDEGIEAEVVGHQLHAVAAPGDTAVVAYGQPDVLWNAGLSSPYPYLWSLPVRVRDPGLDDLVAVLEGPRPPVWVVDWSGFDSWAVDADRFTAVVERSYTRSGRVCGRTVWVLRGADRAPFGDGPCR